jgi:hypothetical protein
MTGKYYGRCAVIERTDGWHIIDTVTKVESGIIPGGLEEARRGARNWENAREDSERRSREAVPA